MTDDPRLPAKFILTREVGFPEEPPRRMGFEDDEVHLRDYWRVVKKHSRMIVAVFGAIVLTTAVVTFTMAPKYTATAKIQIERQRPNFAPVQEVQQVESAAFDKYDYYQTQYDVLESRTIAARVIKALALDTDPRFTGEDDPGLVAGMIGGLFGAIGDFIGGGEETVGSAEMGVDPKLIEQYLETIEIGPVRNSRLVNVLATTEYPEMSAEIANTHIEEYVNTSLEQRLGMTQKAKEFLEIELAKSRDRVNATEAALNDFRKAKGIVSLDGDKSDIVTERLNDLNERHTEAQGERIRLQGQYDLIKSRNFQSLPDVVQSPMIGRMKEELAKVQSERAELGRKFKPGYPKMAELIAKERELSSGINQEVRKIVEGIESGYLAASSREAALAEELEKQRQIALNQKDVGADYDTLKREADTARSLYANLLQRLKDIDVAEEIKVSNVSVVDMAASPRRPSHPKKLLNLALASILGLMIGVGLAFFTEYFDNTLKTPEDVTRVLGLPTLGVVPAFETPTTAYGYGHAHVKKSKNAPDDAGVSQTELVALKHPKSVVAEAYRTIRTGILMSSADTTPQVVLFTSGAAGEGKTVTALNQAVALAQSGGRVLLIDADIRKPRVHQIFQLPNGHGLSTWLSGQTEDLAGAIHDVPLSPNGNGSGGIRLSVLPSGPLPPNPAELLGSNRMRETLRGLRERFDHIVIDTPPILPVTDAALLAAMTDGTVIVVRGQETPAQIAIKSRDRLDYVRAKILGVVLNDVDVTTGDYDQYHRYYYSYYSDGGSRAA